MKKIFIYYSLSGNGDVVAKKFESLGFDIRRVESKLKLSKHLFPCMLKGGFLAGIGSKPKLINYDNNVNDYDEIYIGAPIWNSNLACPINTVLKETNLDNKNVTFVLYSGSGEAKKAIKNLNKNYPNAKIIKLKQPKGNLEELEKLGE